MRWRSSRHARRLLTLGLFGLFIATIARRPEFAGVAAPALLLLAAGRVQRRPPRLTVGGRPERQAGLRGRAGGAGHDGGRTRATARSGGLLHPGREIDPVGAVDRRRAGRPLHLQPATAGGGGQLGTVDVVLRDRWRLAEGHLTVTLPRLDCYPAPAQQRTRVVLSRLPNRLGEHPARDLRRGHRVRRGARVRAGRPAAQHQLAGQHPARAAAGEHLRRRALAGRGAAGRRHLGRGRARVIRAGPGAARRGGRGPRLPGRPGPGGRDHLPVGRR